MGRRRLFWQLFPSYLLITVVAVAAVTAYVSTTTRKFLRDQIAADLRARAHIAAGGISDRLGPDRREELQRFCKTLGEQTATRITIILESGVVVGDSEKDPAVMENHANRPEVLDALRSGSGMRVRHSSTLQQDMMYVAVPIRKNNRVLGVARASLPLSAINRSLHRIYAKTATAGLVVGVLAILVGLVTSRAISRPLEEMKQAAERIAAGDREARLPVPRSEEMRSLAETLNRAAAALNEQIRTIARQRNEQEAILASMVEGVLAVDTDERLIGFNEAAGKILGVRPDHAIGRTVQEAVRNPDIQKIITQVLSKAEPVERDVSITNGGTRLLHIRGTALRDIEGERIGAVIVLNDVTRIRRLEGLRRDFVANVSHELKTPITSIKGFVETLQDGALANRDETERFLGIIARHADRLAAIIEDLLVLSKIEQDDEAGLATQVSQIAGVLKAASDTCNVAATAKQIQVVIHCPDELEAEINAPLLEQAVANLIDNAIKYSAPGSTVEVGAEAAKDQILIHVRDCGCGIGSEHLPRLFERFYRADKAKSSELGGTGLGLAIVKHIVLAHHGRVSVESTPSKGSTFTIHLPAP